MRNLILAVMLAAGPAPAQEFAIDMPNIGEILIRAQGLKDKRSGRAAPPSERPFDSGGSEVIMSLSEAQMARLREIAEKTKPERKAILRMGEGAKWHRFWAFFGSREDSSPLELIELSVRKSSLLWLNERRIDFRISPRTATAKATVYYYEDSCIKFYCEEGSYRIKGMDMGTPVVQEWFREELDYWITGAQ